MVEKKTFWGCTALLFGVPLLGAGLIAAILYWPVVFNPRYTLPIEGQVVDAVTGEPVPKVLVTSFWQFNRPVLVDTNDYGETFNVTTDDEGRFTVPAWKVSRPWDNFLLQTVRVGHPLYEGKSKQVSSRTPRRPPPSQTRGEEPQDSPEGSETVPPTGTASDRKLLIRFEMMKLEDRYSKPEDNVALAHIFRAASPQHYAWLRDEMNVQYDFGTIWKVYERLAHRFPEDAASPNAQTASGAYEEMRSRFSEFEKKN